MNVKLERMEREREREIFLLEYKVLNEHCAVIQRQNPT